MIRYRLRTLLIFLTLGPPVLAGAWFLFASMGVWQSFTLVALVVVGGIAAWISFGPERAFRRELKRRAPLDDDQFFHEFYADTDVPADIVRRLRPIYCAYFDIEIPKLRPSDRPPEIVEIDTVDLVRNIEAEFGLTIPDHESEQLDGSFDSIVRYLADRQAVVLAMTGANPAAADLIDCPRQGT